MACILDRILSPAGAGGTKIPEVSICRICQNVRQTADTYISLSVARRRGCFANQNGLMPEENGYSMLTTEKSVVHFEIMVMQIGVLFFGKAGQKLCVEIVFVALSD